MKSPALPRHLLTLVLLSVAACAVAQQATPEMLKRLLDRNPEADTNKHGKLSGDEFCALKQRLPAGTDARRAMARKPSFANISYRYTTRAPYPAPMLDGARAIQFLRSKSAK